jgi:hypothetical protein
MSSQRMGSGPPKVIEFSIGVLLPPAYREHVLGDLYEQYRSPLQYSVDGARAVASILGSQIIRTWNTWLMLAQALSLIVSFTPFGSVIADSSQMRIAIAVVIPLAVLMLCDAYRSPAPYASRAVTDVTISIGLMFAGETILSAFRPDLVPLSAAFNVAGAVGALSLLLIRRVWPEKQSLRTASGGTARFTPDALQFRVHQVRHKVFTLDAGVLFFVCMLGLLGWGIARQPPLADRIVGGLIIGCALYVFGYRIYQRFSGARPESLNALQTYRAELERLRNDHLHVFTSRGAPIFTAIVAFGVHNFLLRIGRPRPIAGFVVFILFPIVWVFLLKRVNDQQAQKYQQEIDELERRKIEGIEQQ